jgi:hypothetical protein
MTAQPQPSEPASPAELSDEAIREWSRRTRAAKGLPPKITDAATLRRIAVLALGGRVPSASDSR